MLLLLLLHALLLKSLCEVEWRSGCVDAGSRRDCYDCTGYWWGGCSAGTWRGDDWRSTV
jgi:hypothetical protein